MSPRSTSCYMAWRGRCADTVYTGGEKREEQPDELVAARCSTYQKYGKRITLYKAIRRIRKLRPVCGQRSSVHPWQTSMQ